MTQEAPHGPTAENGIPLPRRERARAILRRLQRMAALVLVLLIAGMLRFYNINWDEGLHLHPDERYVAFLATLIQPVWTAEEYFDSGKSTLNPFNTDWGSRYVYGTLPLFGPRYVAEFLDNGCGPAPNRVIRRLNMTVFGDELSTCPKGTMVGFDRINLVGRAWSAAMDLLAIATLYLIAKRLFNWRVGILAASLSALAVLQIQQAHFFTVDATANLFVNLCLLFCVNMVMAARGTRAGPPRPRIPHLAINGLLAGLMAGCAVASKISAWPLVPMILLAAGIHLARDRRPAWRGFYSAGLAVVLAGLGAFAAFRIAQPYSFVGASSAEFRLTLQRCLASSAGDDLIGRLCELALSLPEPVRVVIAPSARWLENLALASVFVNGTIDVPFGHQWANRAPITFPLVNLVFWGLGIALGAAALIGLAYALRRMLKGRRIWAYVLPVVWVTAYFLYQGTQYTKSMRYLLPIYPMLCLLAAVALERVPRLGRINLRIPITALTVGLTLLWSAAFMSIYGEPITRASASRWIYQNIPTAVTMTWRENGVEQRTQLPVQTLRTSFGLPQAFWITPDDLKDRGRIVRSDVAVILNNVSGEALLSTRVIDNAGGTGISGREAQIQVSADRPRIALGDLAFESGHEYYVELYQLAGSGITANASVIANEQWDDPLPQAVDGKYGFNSYYNKLTTSNDGQMQPYNEDTPDTPGSPGKLSQMLNWLDEADVIVLSSNRIYGSVPRLPWRFPLTTEYYRALLGGELGFELAADFHSFPRLGNLLFNSQEMPQPLARAADTAGPGGTYLPYPTAEEAFSVYDHPRVLIFRKTPQYSRRLADSILGKFDLARTYVQTPLGAVNTPRGMLLDDGTRAQQQAGGTWAEVFPPDSPLNQSQAAALLTWLLTIEVIGLGAFPLIALAFRRPDGATAFADGGYAFAKVVGLLLAAFGVWWVASLRAAPFSPALARVALGALVLAGAIVALVKRRWLMALVRARWRALLLGELIFLLGFFSFALIRSGNPDLWHPYFGGEKPMDLAYLTATLKSTYFPPYDPWFSGGYINYYYFGFVLIGVPIKALGIEPGVAYNLAIPALFGMTASAAFGAGASLFAGWRAKRDADDILLPRGTLLAGGLAALLVAGLGNIDAISVLYSNWLRLGGPPEAGTLSNLVNGIRKWLSEGPANFGWPHYWNPTRLTAREAYPVDALPIAEFPLFTFIYADLHAHMMAMPLALTALGMASAFARGARRWGAIAIAAVAVGALWPTNTWDYPVHAALCATAIIAAAASGAAPGQRWRAGMAVVPLAGMFLLATRAAFIPYLENYGTAYNSLGPWTGERTPLWPYISVYALFVVPLAGFGLARIAQSAASQRGGLIALAVAGLAATAFLYLLGVEAAVVAVPMLCICAARILDRRASLHERAAWALAAGAIALTLFVEFFTLKGDIGRMNTVFKFYVQAWLMLGVATAAIAAAGLTDPLQRQTRRVVRPAAGSTLPRTGFALLTAVVVFLAALYPVFAIPAKIADRYAPDAPAGLDGLAYMRFATRIDGPPNSERVFPLRHDYEAIRWMQANVAGSPVIVEAGTGGLLYRWGARFSIYTGLPAVVGWDWHQRQQRAALTDRVVLDRQTDVDAFYNTESVDLANILLARYNIRFVVVGDLEAAYYARPGLDKFERMADLGYLRRAYANEGTRIYAVVE
ncbi:MAG TPA: DUF2298 domain-containing protein [Thermoflexales bacterium]|nr:DUF2298 domain-containing protein [Thermoflexales bacterium]